MKRTALEQADLALARHLRINRQHLVQHSISIPYEVMIVRLRALRRERIERAVALIATLET